MNWDFKRLNKLSNVFLLVAETEFKSRSYDHIANAWQTTLSNKVRSPEEYMFNYMWSFEQNIFSKV